VQRTAIFIATNQRKVLQVQRTEILFDSINSPIILAIETTENYTVFVKQNKKIIILFGIFIPI
jgi:hypothetical protein